MLIKKLFSFLDVSRYLPGKILNIFLVENLFRALLGVFWPKMPKREPLEGGGVVGGVFFHIRPQSSSELQPGWAPPPPPHRLTL